MALLGDDREGNILEMDDDIDICVNLKHREQFIDWRNTLIKSIRENFQSF